jgi:hypothetical protein
MKTAPKNEDLASVEELRRPRATERQKKLFQRLKNINS